MRPNDSKTREKYRADFGYEASLMPIDPSDPWPSSGHPETMKMEPPPRLFSHQYVEVEFCELRLIGFLGNSFLPLALALEPILVVLAVGHGGAFEGGGLLL
jgi:hypothetical protein